MATPRDLGRTLARFVKPEPATWVALASNAGMGFGHMPDGSTMFDHHSGDRTWRHFLLDWLNWSDRADALHEYLAEQQMMVRGRPPAESTDPVFAAIRAHVATREAVAAAIGPQSVPRALVDNESRALFALLRTTPTTLAGCIAFARHLRAENIDDLAGEADGQPSPTELCLQTLADALDSLSVEAWA